MIKLTRLHKRHIKILAPALFVISFLLYAQTLMFNFVWDDYGVIVHNRNIRSFHNAYKTFYSKRQVFSSSYDPSQLTTKNYRPLRTLVHAAVYKFAGQNPLPYHLLNALTHAAVVTMLFLMLIQLSGSIPGSLIGAAFFAVHPVNTEAVCWAKSFEDLIAAFLIISCLYTLSFFRGKSSDILLGVLALLLFVLALTAKLSVVFLPVFLFISWGVDNVRKLKVSWSGAVQRSLTFITTISIMLLAALGAVAVRHLVLGHTAQGHYITGNMWTTWLSMPRVFVRYLWLEVLPVNLLADYEVYPRAMSISDGGAWFYLVVFIFLFVWITRTLFRYNILNGWLWFWCALIPFANIIPMVQLGAERFLYIPTIGFAWLVTAIVKKYADKEVTINICGIILVTFAVMTFIRTGVWRNERTLWATTTEQVPTATRPRENLVKSLLAEKKYPAALKHAIILLKYSNEIKHENLYAYTLCLNGKYAEGMSILVSNRADPIINILGVMAIRNKQPQLALKLFAEAMKIAPNNPRYHHNYNKLKRSIKNSKQLQRSARPPLKE